MTVAVVVEEHPELDNPLGKAQGHVHACQTYLLEATEIVERLTLKVAKAVADLDTARAQLAEATEDIETHKSNLEDAKATLAVVESEQ